MTLWLFCVQWLLNTTFNIPDFDNTFIEGTTDITVLGDLIQAGLPNINATIPLDELATTHGSVEPTGAISRSNSSIGIYQTRNSSATGNYYSFSFNANNSSSIYGNSSTVQPQSIKIFVLIKY